MTTVVQLLLAYAGLAGVAMTTRRHRHLVALLPWVHVPTWVLRLGGGALLGLPLLVGLSADRRSIELVVWLGLLSCASIGLVLGLAYRPRLAVFVALGAPLAGSLLCLVQVWIG